MLHRLFFLADFLVAKIAKKRERKRKQDCSQILSKNDDDLWQLYVSYAKERNILDRERKREKERERASLESRIEKLKSFGFLTRSWQFSNKNNNIFAFSNRALLTQHIHVWLHFFPPESILSSHFDDGFIIRETLHSQDIIYPDRFRPRKQSSSKPRYFSDTNHKLASLCKIFLPTLSSLLDTTPPNSFVKRSKSFFSELSGGTGQLATFPTFHPKSFDRPSFSTNPSNQHRTRGINFPSGCPETLNYNHAPYVIPWRRINVSARRFG